MKERLFKVLHFLKLDVLLLRVLERLLAGLSKKRERLQGAVERFLARHLTATENSPIIA